MSKLLALATVALVVGCGRPNAAGRDTSPATPSASAPRPNGSHPALGPSLPALAQVCAAAPCSGPMSRVTVWRTQAGAVAVFEHAGDIRRCSHPPTVFFDADGKELGAIPLVPVVPGSDEAKKYSDIRDEHTKGLIAAETLSCPSSR